MGQSVCTDSSPTGFDDIKSFARLVNSGGSSSARSGSGDGSNPKNSSSAVPPEIRHLFAPYLHNLKCWSFGFDSATPSVGATPIKLDINTSIDPKKCYLLLHVERVPLPGACSMEEHHHQDPQSATPAQPDILTGGSAGAASSPWAIEVLDAFTPRGLKEACSVDLMTMRWRHIPQDATHKYGFSLFVLNGKEAETLVVATATARSYELEGVLHRSQSLVERLFFNETTWKMGTDPSNIPGHVTMAIKSNSSSRRNSGSGTAAGTGVTTGYLAEKVALFRKLQRLSPIRHKTQENVTRLDDLSEAAGSSAGPSPCATPPQGLPKAFSLNLSAAKRNDETPVAAVDTPPVAAGGDDVDESTTTDEDCTSSGEDDRASPGDEPSTGSIFHPPMGLPKLGQVAAPEKETARGGRPAPDPTARGGLAVAGNNAFDSTPNDDAGNSDTIEADRVRRLKESSPVATLILDYLFVGGETPALDKKLLVSTGITHVVNCGALAIPSKFTDCFTYDSLFLGDSPDEEISPFFPQIIEHVEREAANQGKVYVHCHQGVSRSVSFVCAYTMWRRGQTYDEVLKFVKKSRTVASPNAGFYVTLLGFEKWLSDPLSQVREWTKKSAARNNVGEEHHERLSKNGLVVYRYQSFRPGGKEQNREYLFPLAYNLLYPPQKGSQAQNTYSQEGSAQVDLDPRSCYLIFNVANPQDPKISFIPGAESSKIFTAEAERSIATLLQYGFYTQPAITQSTSGKGEVLEFTPRAFHQASVSTIAPSQANTVFPAAEFGVEFSEATSAGYDVYADVEEFDDQIRTCVQTPREEASTSQAAAARVERRQAVASGDCSSVPPVPAIGGLREVQQTPTAGEDEEQPEESGGGDNEDLVDVGAPWDPLTILTFPDLNERLEEFYDPADLEPELCYLVVNRKIGTSSHPNVMYIWCGSAAEESQDELLDRFEEWVQDETNDQESYEGSAWRVANAVLNSGGEPLFEMEGEETDEFYRLVE